MKIYGRTAKYIVRNIKNLFGYPEQNAIPAIAHEGEDMPPADEAINHGFVHAIVRYGSCIILSASQIGQVAIAFFIPGRRGEEAAELLDRAAQVAAIAAHAAADRIEDNDFYAQRALLQRSIAHPDIEWWAEYASRSVNSAAGLANVATQLIATNRMPITLNHIVMITHGIMLTSSMAGYPWPEAAVHTVQSISLCNAASAIASLHLPTLVVGITSNSFWDWVSDDVIRVGIYAVADRVENTLDWIYTTEHHENAQLTIEDEQNFYFFGQIDDDVEYNEIAPANNAEHHEDVQPGLFPDNDNNMYTAFGIWVISGLIYIGADDMCG